MGPFRAQTQARPGLAREHFYGPEDLCLKAICKADINGWEQNGGVLSSIFKSSVGETIGGLATSRWVASFTQVSEWNLAFHLGGQAASPARGWLGACYSQTIFSGYIQWGTVHHHSLWFGDGEKWGFRFPSVPTPGNGIPTAPQRGVCREGGISFSRGAVVLTSVSVAVCERAGRAHV